MHDFYRDVGNVQVRCCEKTDVRKTLKREAQKCGIEDDRIDHVVDAVNSIGQYVKKLSMDQLRGTMPGEICMTMTMPIEVQQSRNTFQKRFQINGTSVKKLLSSKSLFVAPQDMSIPKGCAKSAVATWKDKPPKKIDRQGIHLACSINNAPRLPCLAR